jgi:hypothetical protein
MGMELMMMIHDNVQWSSREHGTVGGSDHRRIGSALSDTISGNRLPI